jgi:hypothetical protein
MLILLSVWLATGIGLVWIVTQHGKGSAGLPLAYFIALSLIHVPGAMLYLGSEESLSMAIMTKEGFEQTVIGMTAFLMGVIIARYVSAGSWGRQASQPHDFVSLAGLDRLALLYLLVGGVCYFGLRQLVGSIPSAPALIAPLGSLMIIGACLWLWVTREKRESFKFWLMVAFLPVLPLTTLIRGGFLGFGTFMVLTIVAFLIAQSRRRVGVLLLAPVVIYAGLSIFVNYMAARGELRQLVWHQSASISERLERVIGVFRDFSWLDLTNPQHQEAIDARLNQNWFIGAAKARLDSGLVEYGSADALARMIIAPIPRFLWPDKPVIGGGGTVVHDYTGIEFAEGTSIGAGQVFEFYVYFGTLGVVGGFLLLGWLAGRIDLWVIGYLHQGDQRRFVFWFLICLALLQAGGNLLEIIGSTAASIITGYVVGYFLQSRQSTLRHRSFPARHS